jgi:hypothetical protein
MKNSKSKNISVNLHPRTKKGTYRAKNQKETKDKYNKQKKSSYKFNSTERFERIYSRLSLHL